MSHQFICFPLVTGIKFSHFTRKVLTERFLGLIDARTSQRFNPQGMASFHSNDQFPNIVNSSQYPSIIRTHTHGNTIIDIILESLPEMTAVKIIPILVSNVEERGLLLRELSLAFNCVREISTKCADSQSIIIMSQGIGFGSHDGTENIDILMQDFSEENPSVLFFVSAGNEAKEDRHSRIRLEKSEKYIIPFGLHLKSQPEYFGMYYSSLSNCSFAIYNGSQRIFNGDLEGRNHLEFVHQFLERNIELCVEWVKQSPSKPNTSSLLVKFSRCQSTSDIKLELTSLRIEIICTQVCSDFPYIDAYARKSFPKRSSQNIRGGVRFYQHVSNDISLSESGNNESAIVITASQMKDGELTIMESSSRGSTRRQLPIQPTLTYNLSERTHRNGTSFAVSYFVGDLVPILLEVYQRFNPLTQLSQNEIKEALSRTSTRSLESCSYFGYGELDKERLRFHLLDILRRDFPSNA